MSCNAGDIVACPQVQAMLLGYFGSLNGVQTSLGAPLVEFLRSPTNTNGAIQSVVNPNGSGKYRTLELVYESRDLVSSVSKSAKNVCEGGAEPCNTSEQYTIDIEVGHSRTWTIDLDTVAAQCEGDETYFARQIVNKMDVITRSMDVDFMAEAYTLYGKYPSQVAAAVISVATKNSNSVYIPDFAERVRFETLNAEQNSQIALFGGSLTFQTYFEQYLGSVPNTTLGIDVAKMIREKGTIAFFDPNAETPAAGSVLALMPGALQLITYNKYQGGKFREINSPLLYQGVLFDPRTMLYFDYQAKYECEQWNFYLGVADMLVQAPSDLFFSGDRLSRFNGINRYRIVNP